MGAFDETILANAQACTSCLACELACGFRWTKKMDPSRSEIRVRRIESTGLVEIEVLAGCDACTRFGGEFGAVVTALRRRLGTNEDAPSSAVKRLDDALSEG